MRNLVLIFMPLAIFANCQAPAEQPNPDKYHKPETSEVTGATGLDNAKSADLRRGDAMSPFNADGSVKSSFPPGVVKRLNAIMKRGQDTMAAYDKARPGIERAQKAGKSKQAIAKIAAFHNQTVAIKNELGAEGQKLVDTKNYYDVVVFSGMASFATKIEKELGDDLTDSQKPK